MDKSRVISVIKGISSLLAVGLIGYFVGLRGNEGEGVADHAELVSEVCASVQPENVRDLSIEGGENSVVSVTPNGRKVEPEAIVVSSESADNEQKIQQALSVDESAISQESERPPVPQWEGESDGGSIERIRMLAADEQVKYVKALVDDQDDASIAELKDLIIFDDEAVRHTAIDTLIKIMDQETGHYAVIEAALVDNSVFMDESQVEKFSKISSRVVEKEYQGKAGAD